MKPPRTPSTLTLPHVLRLRRRPLAALCTFLAVVTALLALAPRPVDSRPVVVAARPLPAGTVLAPGDLSLRSLPLDAIPDGAAAQVPDVTGATLSGPMTAGRVVTEASIATGERLARPGLVVVALPLPSSAIAALVRPGAAIDLIGADGGTLAADVRVLSAPDSTNGLGSGSRAALVEVTPQVASQLAQRSAVDTITIAVR